VEQVGLLAQPNGDLAIDIGDEFSVLPTKPLESLNPHVGRSPLRNLFPAVAAKRNRPSVGLPYQPMQGLFAPAVPCDAAAPTTAQAFWKHRQPPLCASAAWTSEVDARSAQDGLDIGEEYFRIAHRQFPDGESEEGDGCEKRNNAYSAKAHGSPVTATSRNGRLS
jgi:hypothetical protein